MTTGATRVVGAGCLLWLACAQSNPGQPADGGLANGEVDAAGGVLSCAEREQRSAVAVHSALDGATLNCVRASDCVDISIDTECRAACGALVSTQDRAAIEAVIDEQNATTCHGFKEHGCDRSIPPCDAPLPADCVAGRCERLRGRPEDAGPNGSVHDAREDGCLVHAITWGEDEGRAAARTTFTLAPCRAFSAHQESAGNPPEQICNNLVPTDGNVTADDIDELIANAEVQAAIGRAPILYGIDSRETGGTVFRIELGGATIDVGAACGAAPACVDTPAGIVALQRALHDLLGQQHGVPPTCMNTT